ncbi:MAG: RNase adapter protein RapZ [Solirubrobacteraceae bacterium]|nr:RNase adapter protein RapZ [Solirubrobacteraceae bacterium]
MAMSRPASLSDRLWRSRRERNAITPESNLDDLVIITGFSGAGKSSAMAVFEDAGYFCVDNLPPEMIRSLAELFMHQGSKVRSAAIVSDVRGGAYFEGLVKVLAELDSSGLAYRVIFLEADDQTLLDRYKETRRRHPLAPSGSVAEGIAAERALLVPIRERATAVFDTSGLTPVMLRRKLADELLAAKTPSKLAVTFNSFGHKHGPMRDADLAFDVRFLPNPHYEPDLRPLTGLDDKVVEYIGRDGQIEQFYEHLTALLDYLLAQYVREGKAHLTVGIGCTGGRHRSVAIAEWLAANYRERGEYTVGVVHRDIDKPPRGA